VPLLVQVDLALPNLKSAPPIVEGQHAQAEGTHIEVAGGRDIANREHDVVNPVELHQYHLP
jgi:hypothetical protein